MPSSSIDDSRDGRLTASTHGIKRRWVSRGGLGLGLGIRIRVRIMEEKGGQGRIRVRVRV